MESALPARVHRLSSVLVLVIAVALVAAAVVIPPLMGWDVHARDDGHVEFAPWHGWWEPHVGPGTCGATTATSASRAASIRVAGARGGQRLNGFVT